MRTYGPLKALQTVVVALIALSAASAAPVDNQAPLHIGNATLLERGKYMIVTGHCNNCHTDGYAANAGEIPEAKWLLGNSVGWRGKAGTVYAPNLRCTFNQCPWRLGSWPQETRGREHLCLGGAFVRPLPKI